MKNSHTINIEQIPTEQDFPCGTIILDMPDNLNNPSTIQN
ncbi:hypothetical protein OENI_120003 [Oenococcus oeni]|nr:hypothetical protein OENI_120003 [Oenococcus oeni]